MGLQLQLPHGSSTSTTSSLIRTNNHAYYLKTINRRSHKFFLKRRLKLYGSEIKSQKNPFR